jgi:anti-sigma B factor antagonist
VRDRHGAVDHGDEPLAPHLELHEEAPDGATRVLALRGELDVATVERFRHALGLLTDDPEVMLVVVDLAEVTFIDSTGLMTLLNALRRLVRRGARLVIACRNPTVLRLFEATKTDATFEIVPTRDQALSA